VILVIGARSKVGSEVTRLLRQRGDAVRILSRNPEDVPQQGVETARGDLGDEASLVAAMTGVQAVFLVSSTAADQVEQHARAVSGALRTGVGHLVRMSILGADPAAPCLLRGLNGRADAHLAASGLPYTVLRPHYFQQNVPDSVVPSLGEQGELFAPAGDARLSMVDTRDIAAVAASVLGRPEHHGRSYDVTGPEALNHDDVAALLAPRLGRAVRYVDIPSATMREAITKAGVRAWLADILVGLYDDYRASGPTGFASRVDDTVERLTGSPARPLRNLLDERLAPPT
jgi:uncharacterized protein YbjT (DUF2867 family)